MAKIVRVHLLIAFILLVGACNQSPPETTAVPTEAAPATAAPTHTPLPPTEAPPTATPLPSATATATTPPATATATATPVVAPLLSITAPQDGGALPVGDEVVVSGYGYLDPETTVKVGLTSATGWNLATGDATADENGWEATIAVPPSVSGAAALHAAIVTNDGEVLARDTIPVTLRVQEPPEGGFLVLSRPGAGGMAVAGHSLFFDGRLEKEGGGRLKLSVWMGCQTEVAEYSFSLRSSTTWQGYVILPEDLSGPACAVASVGQTGRDGWLAAQVPITLLSQDDEQAVGVMIANPGSGWTVRGGTSLRVNGIAYNAPRGGVKVQIVLANGQIVAESAVQPDFYGYWETTVDLPADLNDQAVIQANMESGDTLLASDQVLLNVVPGVEPAIEP